MLTSESEPHQEPPLPGDSCTGHIFKLMNIQQQLMKTNLKQMDSLTPSAVTAQDPSGAPHDQDADGHFLPCASEPTASLQLASPGAAESCQRCRGSTVGQTEGSCDLPGVATEEDTDPSCRTRSTGVARTGCEVGPAPATDPGAASAPDSCVQSLPDSRGEGPEGLPSCGVRDDETTFLAGATDLASPGSVLQGGVAQVCSGGKLVVASPAGASAPEAAGEGEHGLMHPDAAIRGNMLEVEESMKKRFEDSSISTAGASDGKAADEPVDGASLPDSVLAASPLDANKPAESILAISNGKAVIDQTAETETSKSCEESAHTPGAQNLQLVPAAAGDEVSEGLQPNTPLASAESTTPGRLGTRPPPTARCPSGPQASSTQITPDTPERVEASLQVSDKESQGEALKVETSSADPAEVVPHPQAAPPKAEKEGASGPAVTPGGTLSLAGSPGSESVTKDDALSLVPSQSEKGRAALQPHTDGGDGPDGDARHVEVENPSPGKSAGCEVSGDAVLDGARVHGLQEALGAGTKDISHNAPDTLSCQEENMILGLPGASPATGVTNPQGTAPPELVAPPGGEKKLEGADCGSIGPQEAQGNSKTHHDPLQPVGGERPPEMGPSGEARGAPALPCTVSTKALHRPEGADSIEEAASRIVDSVIEQVKASGALMTGGALGHRSPPRPPEAGPGTEPTARASAGETSALQPAETPPVGSGGGEASGSLEQCFAGSEEPEMVLPVQGPAPETEMPDTKAEDEVNFLSNTRESSVSEEAALGNRTSTPEVKQGPKTQAILPLQEPRIFWNKLFSL
ncbi:hypothetical protein Celaphus_00015173, partial [Cervus elaphus hippelaphus]